jgi:hypothetical protein
MPITPLTKLEAVNQMLSAIGESPINTLGTGTSVDARLAEQILDETDRNVQLVGWHFNTEKEYPLSRAVDKTITLANNVVRVDVDNDLYPSINVVQRGLKLYDLKGHTYEFNQDLKGEVIYLLSFEELPGAAKQYITARAARIFQDRVVGATDTARGLMMDEANALALLREADNDTGDFSIFDSYDVARTIFR